MIRVQSAEHGAKAATASISQLHELLGRTTLPPRVTTQLLDGVSPLWVLSESPEVLATDLVLCHPKFRTGEVRAVARPMPDGTTFRLTVVAGDRPGFLADTAATLADEGVSIEAASVTTSPGGRVALHALTVRSRTEFDEQRWTSIGSRLRATAPNCLGLLAPTCRWFADQGLSIEAADISTVLDNADDVFLVDGDCDTELLARHLSGRSASGATASAGLLGPLRRCAMT